MKHHAIAAPASATARAPRPQQARRPGMIRRFLPEIALVTVMVALAIGLRAVAFFH